MKKLSQILILTLITFSSFSQKELQVTASGESISRDLTIDKAKAKAIDDAKYNALLKAGISESIKVSNFLYQFEDNQKFLDIFQAYTSTETGGEVLVDSILKEQLTIDLDGNMIAKVEILATVYKHKSRKDPSFDFNVEGILEFYPNNSFMQFIFIPERDGYLKIFNVLENDASILYPYTDTERSYLSDPSDEVFEKGKEYRFPLNKYFDERGYELEISNTETEREFNLLIFVFTTYDKSFRDEINIKNIMKWIYSIPMKDRSVKQFGFVIKK